MSQTTRGQHTDQRLLETLRQAKLSLDLALAAAGGGPSSAEAITALQRLAGGETNSGCNTGCLRAEDTAASLPATPAVAGG
jgi:hypothetical protein